MICTSRNWNNFLRLTTIPAQLEGNEYWKPEKDETTHRCVILKLWLLCQYRRKVWQRCSIIAVVYSWLLCGVVLAVNEDRECGKKHGYATANQERERKEWHFDDCWCSTSPDSPKCPVDQSIVACASSSRYFSTPTPMTFCVANWQKRNIGTRRIHAELMRGCTILILIFQSKWTEQSF